MGVLDAAMHADRMKQQGFQKISGAMGRFTETRKAERFKQAGKKLAELGGLSKENLKQVVNEFDLDPEQTKELVTTWGSFHKTMREMKGKSTTYYGAGGLGTEVGEGEVPPPDLRTKEGWGIKRAGEEIEAKKVEKKKGKVKYQKFGNELIKINEDGKSEVIRTMSIEGRAVTNAMADPEWWGSNETEQAQLIEKHKRFLTGKTKPTTSEIPPGAKTATNPKTGEKAWQDTEGKWHIIGK